MQDRIVTPSPSLSSATLSAVDQKYAPDTGRGCRIDCLSSGEGVRYQFLHASRVRGREATEIAGGNWPCCSGARVSNLLERPRIVDVGCQQIVSVARVAFGAMVN